MAKYQIIYTRQFKRDLRKISKRGVDIVELEKVVKHLADGKELATKYRNHLLTGKWTGHYECHIKPDWLLVYYKDDDVLVLTLTRTGTHSDLF